MNTWITTDWHFNHRNIIEYEGRPDGFEELIITNHSKLIKPEDTMICLGDTIFARNTELQGYLDRIVCRSRILVRGNHDEGFTDTWLMNKGFNVVCDSMTIRGVLLSHAPMLLSDDVPMNVHGHMHSGRHRKDDAFYPYYCERHVLLGLENTQYYPVSLEDIINRRYTEVVNGNNVIRR